MELNATPQTLKGTLHQVSKELARKSIIYKTCISSEGKRQSETETI